MAKYIPGQEPDELKERLNNYFLKIKEEYPDKVIENIHKEHRNWSMQASEFAEKLGYENNTAFFAAYGYTLVGGSTRSRSNTYEVAEINKEDYVFDNSNVLYTPGNEPDIIKKKLDKYFPKIAEAFPDRQIRHFSRDYKKWDERAAELRKMLGYESKKAFFAAYGFYMVDGNAEQKLNLNNLIEELKKRYKDNPFAGTINDLKAANPDISGNIQTLNNRASKEFGMPLRQYLVSVGVMAEGERKNAFEYDTLFSEFINIWEKDGCKQYNSLTELNKDYEYMNPTMLNRWTNATYGITATAYMEISGVLRIKAKYESTNKRPRKTADAPCDDNQQEKAIESKTPESPEELFQYVGFTHIKRNNRYDDECLKNRISVLTEENDEPFRIVYVPYRFDLINDVKKEPGFFDPDSRADVISYGRASYKYDSEPELVPVNSSEGYLKLAKLIKAIQEICTEENITKLLPLIPRKKDGTFRVNRVTPVIWNEAALGDKCYALLIRATDDNIAEVKLERNDCDHSAMRKMGEAKFTLDNYKSGLFGE